MPTCHCTSDWDLRCGCFPPTADALVFCQTHVPSTDLFWGKADAVEDNWPDCPNRCYKAANFAHGTLHRLDPYIQLKLIEHMGLRPADWPEAKRQLLGLVYNWEDGECEDAATTIQRAARNYNRATRDRMDREYEETLEAAIRREREEVADFVNTNPYPSHQEIGERMHAAWDRHTNPTILNSIEDWMDDYDRTTHELCKAIYEDFGNPASRLSTTRLAGERLYHTRGKSLMQSAFYVLANFVNFTTIAPRSVFKTHIQSTWSGVGDWRN